MELILGLVIGICLSAACGFRVFLPLMGMSIAALLGRITLSSGFEWIGTWPALIVLATATAVEIGAESPIRLMRAHPIDPDRRF